MENGYQTTNEINGLTMAVKKDVLSAVFFVCLNNTQKTPLRHASYRWRYTYLGNS